MADNLTPSQQAKRRAADEMVDSNWYKQVKSRGPRTVALMRQAAK